MNYFYDVLINMNEESIYNFYEWENYDPIELVKKIPLYRVNSSTLKDFYLYNIKVTQEFLNNIIDKTIIKNNKLNKTIKYACLLCDTKNSLVIEFDDEGNVLSRSSLLLDDEANVLEFIYSYKITNIEYKKNNNIAVNKLLRQEEHIKKMIMLEINTLIKENNVLKLKYLFNEWFEYEEDNINNIKDKVKEELSNNITIAAQKIYKLISLSYNKS